MDCIVVFFIYKFAIWFISFLAKGSPPVKLTLSKELPRFLVSFSISEIVNSFSKVLGSSKSIKQNEHLALHLLVKKWTKLTGSFLSK